jgi:hypothetical protein
MTLALARPTDKLTGYDFVNRANEIFDVLAEHVNLRAGYDVAVNRYAKAEPNLGLRKFAQLLLAAGNAHNTSLELRRLRKQEDKYGRLDRADITRQGELVAHACAFNGMLVTFINRYRDLLDYEVFTEWLAEVAGNDQGWARGLVAGMAAEVIGADIVAPLVKSLRKADAAADQAGFDLTFNWTPKGIRAIDVKTGRSCKETPVLPWRNRAALILSIDSQHVDGFYLKPEFMEFYRREVKCNL